MEGMPFLYKPGPDEPMPLPVPWDIISPHEAQAEKTHSQTLERLRERGGLAPAEMVAVLEDRPWHQMDDGEALERIAEIIREHTAALGA